LEIIVDGNVLAAPQTFNWSPGSSHTIDVRPVQGGASTRRLFVGWNDEPSRNRTITASPTATTYTANFQTQFALTTAVSQEGLGTITARPASDDGFYDSGTVVQLTVSGPFDSWSGDLSGSANPATITMSGPRSLTAHFITLPPPPTVRLVTGGTMNPLPGALNPTQQQPIQVNVPETYPATMTGQLTIGFVPNAINNADDPNVTFANGRRTLDFTVPANTPLAQFPSAGGMVQAGTVAGTITITLTNLRVGDVPVIPSTPPAHQISIAQAAPVLLDNVRVVRKEYGFDVEMTGYSNTREIRQAVFRFTPLADRKNLQTLELTVDVSSAATTWYTTPASVTVGSTFHYVQPFMVQGDITDIGSVSVTLVNTRGNSEARTGRF
jgi:hypothetical protein